MIPTSVLFILLVIVLIISFASLIFFLLREVLIRPHGGNEQNDVTNMMILFQTMRDLLSEQKELARQFNYAIDKKVSEVRTLLDGQEDMRGQLLEARRDIAQLTEDTRRELAALARKAGVSEEELATFAAPSRTNDSESEDEAKPTADAKVVEEAEASPSSNGSNGTSTSDVEDAAVAPLRAIPEEPPDSNRDFIDAWASVDFGVPIPEVEEEPAHVIEDPEDSTANSREAYRSLLNVELDAAPAEDPFASEVEGAQQGLTPIQMRVYEYSDAGMRVPEIARELGVGKGEVRLILSLRKGKQE